MPTRAVRPKTATEKAFCSLGAVAESFIKGAAARGMTSLKGDLEELAQMQAAHGEEVLVAALDRAVAFGRFRAHDVRITHDYKRWRSNAANCIGRYVLEIAHSLNRFVKEHLQVLRMRRHCKICVL